MPRLRVAAAGAVGVLGRVDVLRQEDPVTVLPVQQLAVAPVAPGDRIGEVAEQGDVALEHLVADDAVLALLPQLRRVLEDVVAVLVVVRQQVEELVAEEAGDQVQPHRVLAGPGPLRLVVRQPVLLVAGVLRHAGDDDVGEVRVVAADGDVHRVDLAVADHLVGPVDLRGDARPRRRLRVERPTGLVAPLVAVGSGLLDAGVAAEQPVDHAGAAAGEVDEGHRRARVVLLELLGRLRGPRVRRAVAPPVLPGGVVLALEGLDDLSGRLDALPDPLDEGVRRRSRRRRRSHRRS